MCIAILAPCYRRKILAQTGVLFQEDERTSSLGLLGTCVNFILAALLRGGRTLRVCVAAFAPCYRRKILAQTGLLFREDEQTSSLAVAWVGGRISSFFLLDVLAFFPLYLGGVGTYASTVIYAVPAADPCEL